MKLLPNGGSEGNWAAPTAAGFSGQVALPGSKSLTARHLVLAALATAPTELVGALAARDTDLLATALAKMGATVTKSEDAWRVAPGPLRGGATIDCGLAGTVMRFLLPLAALAPGTTTFVGDEAATARPLGGLIEALRTLGASITCHGPDGFLPLNVTGGIPLEGEVHVDSAASSQFLSALLLASAASKSLRIYVKGEPPSQPHIDMTIATLRAVGCGVTQTAPAVFDCGGRRPRGGKVQVEPDLSNAGTFLAAAIAGKGQVRIPNWPSHTTQVGAKWPEILEKMGAKCQLRGTTLHCTGGSGIRPLHRNMRDEGELVPTVVALAALAGDESVLTGISHLRGHETDRLAALATEITRLGGDVTELEDGLVIRPRKLHAALVQTYADHRMATFGAIIGLAVPGVVVQNVATTDKTMPNFVQMWKNLVDG
ncbi:MAG: 3-phosphoshikimate 1-carboxyvinyltransferase [Actinomycetaceae bacterium]|nr:3-phosphoshikimate 1-carboxyvinyltransferase [Actinomycetaceae bacterium]